MLKKSINKLFRGSRNKGLKGTSPSSDSSSPPDAATASDVGSDGSNVKTRNTAPTRPRIDVNIPTVSHALDEVDDAREHFNDAEKATHNERKLLIAARGRNETLKSELTPETKSSAAEYSDYEKIFADIQNRESGSTVHRSRKHEDVDQAVNIRTRREFQEDELLEALRRREDCEGTDDPDEIQACDEAIDRLSGSVVQLCEGEAQTWIKAAQNAVQERESLNAARMLALQATEKLMAARDVQIAQPPPPVTQSDEAHHDSSTVDRAIELEKAMHALEDSRANREADLDRALKALEASRSKPLPGDAEPQTGQYYDTPLDFPDEQMNWPAAPLKSDFEPADAMDLAKLREENKILKEQACRALKELKAYQAQYPSPYTFTGDVDNGDTQVWATSADVVAPLFAAYDTRIAELQDTVNVLNSRIDDFKDNTAVLVKENEELRAAHLDKLNNASADGGAGLDPSAPINAEIISELTEQVEVLRGENNILSEQRLVLMNELDNHQAELEKKTNELAEQAQQLTTALQSAQMLQNRVLQVETERDEAAAHALSKNNELGKTVIELEAAAEQVSVLKQKNREAEALVGELRRQLKATSEKSDVESSSSLQKVIQAEDRVKELQIKLQARSQELDAANTLNRKLRNEYQTTRQDAEGMLQVMSGLERQLSEYAARESEVEKQAKLGKEKEEEALTIKEQCAAREEQYKREIDRLINERKTIALRRKDELENALEQSRKLMSDHASNFEKEIDELAERNAKLIFEAEKAARESRSAKELLEKLTRIHEEEKKSVHSTVRDLTEQLQATVLAKEQEIGKRQDALEQCRELRSNTDKLRAQLEEVRALSAQTERTQESTITTLKANIRDLQKELTEKSRLLSRRNKELEDLKSTSHSQLSATQRKYQDESAIYQLRAAEAERLVRDLEASGFANDLKAQGAIDEMKEKYSTAMAQLETKLRAEIDSSRALSMKIRNSETVVADLLEEKSNLAQIIEDLQLSMKQLDEELLSAKNTISDLTSQLASSHTAREEGAHRAARAIEDVHTVGSPMRGYYGEQKVTDSMALSTGFDARRSGDSFTSSAFGAQT